MAQLELSVIIPTFNRSDVLIYALETLSKQTLSKDRFEIVVVDNGSKDSTRNVVEVFRSHNPDMNVKYIFDDIPGLLTGRHHGMNAASGSLLSFIDDDVQLDPKWAESVIDGFNDPEVHLVGGPCLPNYETLDIPSWVNYLWHKHFLGQYCPFYSLLDLGSEKAFISPNLVWGLNFSIRKQSLLSLGGFHPDCMPPTLAYLTGTGETGVTRAMKKNGWKALYHPGAKVLHLVSKGRLTLDYVKKRAFYQGLTLSAYEYRITNHIDSDEVPDNFVGNSVRVIAHKIFDKLYRNKTSEFKMLQAIISAEEKRGFDFHRQKMKEIPGLSDWMLKKDYFNYEIPKDLIRHEV